MIEVLFVFFKLLLLFSALMVVVSRNPVHSVLFLVLVFVNASAILFMFDAEFIAVCAYCCVRGCNRCIVPICMYDA